MPGPLVPSWSMKIPRHSTLSVEILPEAPIASDNQMRANRRNALSTGPRTGTERGSGIGKDAVGAHRDVNS
jgi:hypothetical protein